MWVRTLSKAPSGLFLNTRGYSSEYLLRWLEQASGGEFERPLESTAVVWDRIEAIAENYPGTQLPKSFVLSVDGGRYIINGNGMKHMYEAVISVKNLPIVKSANPNLFTQLVLYDFMRAVASAASEGVSNKGRAVRVGSWELVFGQRSSDKYPVIYHALFRGLS